MSLKEESTTIVQLTCEYLKDKPLGASPKEIADALGHGNLKVRAALQTCVAKSKIKKLARGTYALKEPKAPALAPPSAPAGVSVGDALNVLETGIVLLRLAMGRPQ